MSQCKRALVLNLTHYSLDHSRLTLAVTTGKGHFVATFDGERSVGEHLLAVVALPYPFGYYGVAAAAWARRKLKPQRRIIFFVDLHNFEFLKPLDLALHLIGLGVGTLEAFDKLTGLGYLFLLVVELLLLLLSAFLAQFQIVAVIGLVVVYSAHCHLDGAGGDVVDKATVVADYHHSHRAVHDKILEPSHRLNIEVIGRLVEQQYVRFLQQQFGQLDAHAPSSGELRGRPGEIAAFESEAQKSLLDILLEVSHVDCVELFAHRGHLLD